MSGLPASRDCEITAAKSGVKPFEERESMSTDEIGDHMRWLPITTLPLFSIETSFGLVSRTPRAGSDSEARAHDPNGAEVAAWR